MQTHSKTTVHQCFRLCRCASEVVADRLAIGKCYKPTQSQEQGDLVLIISIIFLKRSIVVPESLM